MTRDYDPIENNSEARLDMQTEDDFNDERSGMSEIVEGLN